MPSYAKTLAQPIPDPRPRSRGPVLIVNDDCELRRVVYTALRDHGFDVLEASCGQEALVIAGAFKLDAVVLDMNGPAIHSVEICRELRQMLPKVAIVTVTDRDSPDDRERVLDAGGDDYIVRPCQMANLMSRIRSAVEHARPPRAQGEPAIRVGDIALYPVRRRVEKAGRPVRVTAKEFLLLSFLMRHAGVPVTHERLLEVVWGLNHSKYRAFGGQLVRRLRRKLEEDYKNPKYLLTDNQFGYHFADPKSLAVLAKC